MIKVLSIGNSFSQDAQRYLHKLAEIEGVSMKCVNLYIGGCSLRMHYMNMIDDKYSYFLEYNGENTGLLVSIAQALKSDNWDYVTLQQVSHESPFFDSYIPYISALAEYVKKYSPKSKLIFHQTWAYEAGSDRLTNELGYSDPHDMLVDIIDAGKKAAELINADGIIPCGELMMKAIDSGLGPLHRDTFHAERGLGRYILALAWFMKLTGKKAVHDFNAFDVETDNEKVKAAKQITEEFILSAKGE